MKNKASSEEDLIGLNGYRPTNILPEQAENHSAFLKYVQDTH